MSKLKVRLSPRKYDCGHFSLDRYYYEDKKTGKTLCDKCYQLKKRRK